VTRCRGREAADTNSRHERGRHGDADARDGQEPAYVFGAYRLRRQLTINELDLGIEEIDLAEARLHRLPLVARELLIRQPPLRPFLPKRSEMGGQPLRLDLDSPTPP
jgi:hypothetical protein